MKFGIENNVIASYKRLSYDAWYAFAEFVDNSTQSYFDNREILDSEYERTGDRLRISIDYNREQDTIVIVDNSIGMDNEDLERAFKVGQPPVNPHGRSKYGLGMKTAACWFGDNWTIKTKKLGESKSYQIRIDVAEIAKTEGEVVLNPELVDEDNEQHYTKITITDLNRKFVGKTLWKIRDFLGSIYRFDILEGIEIKWNGTPLTWISYEDELHITQEGVRFKKMFDFEINSKPVGGWVGVLGKGFGSRKKAGFSIIQNRRVIQTGYKPTSIYGDQEDGGNDLINQRVVGELLLDKFSVSHTKDKIVWEGEEEDLLNEKIGEYCNDARELALTLRFNKEPMSNLSKFKEEAISILATEFKSDEITNYLTGVQPYPERIIEASFRKAAKAVSDGNTPALEARIGSSEDAIEVLIFFNEKSEFDPYELMEATIAADKVVVIINMLHPHIQEMSTSDAFTNFVRHCVYDGVSEWKATKLRGSLQPYTIKFLKDGLLRIPFEIKSHQAV